MESLWFLLVGFELSVREADLLPGLERWHTQVGAARTSECVTQIALKESMKKVVYHNYLRMSLQQFAFDSSRIIIRAIYFQPFCPCIQPKPYTALFPIHLVKYQP